MARNIEIKARVDDLDALETCVAAIADSGPVVIFQDDTFFACDDGRLKLRDFGDGSGELIFYRRPDQPGPKESFYLRSPTNSPATLRDVLDHSNGITGRVVKRRILYRIGQTRVHLDRVEGLGEFMELEVVLDEHDSRAHGAGIARDLMTRLGIADASLVDGAYLDLLHARGAA